MDRTDWRYELKYLVPDETADRALAWARVHLPPDPHADPSLGDGYRISTLYFDTPELGVFHQLGTDKRRKYRVRRYGSGALLCLERKLKAKGRVRKYRSWIPEDELELLLDGQTDRFWSGDWFRRRVHARDLVPTCRVTYDRVARVGELEGQNVRLTVDRQIRCSLAEDLTLSDAPDGVLLLPGESILELKYAKVMPQAFQDLLDELSLSPDRVSKYRLGVPAVGLAKPAPAPPVTAASSSAPAPQPLPQAAAPL
jgi:hypothetical protein